MPPWAANVTPNHQTDRRDLSESQSDQRVRAYKAMVMLYMAGGAGTFNLLIPQDGSIGFNSLILKAVQRPVTADCFKKLLLDTVVMIAVGYAGEPVLSRLGSASFQICAICTCAGTGCWRKSPSPASTLCKHHDTIADEEFTHPSRQCRDLHC